MHRCSDRGLLTEEASRVLNDAYIANAITQLAYVALIADSGRPGIIMEDDIMPLITNIGHRLALSLAELPDDADMLYLEACFEQCDKTTPYKERLLRLHAPYCSAAILFTAKGARRVKTLCSPIFHGIDVMYPLLIERGQLVAYGTRPMLFAQDEFFGSDAGRPAETFEAIHRTRVPFCSHPTT